MSMQKTDLEQWGEIAKAVEHLETAQFKLLNELAREGNVPKSVCYEHINRIEDSTSQLKSDLETRMFREHPEDASIDVFYNLHEVTHDDDS